MKGFWMFENRKEEMFKKEKREEEGNNSPGERPSEVTGESIRINVNPCLYIFSHALSHFKKTFP